MAIHLHVDLGIRRGSLDGDKLAAGPDRFSRNRVIDRARGGFVDLFPLQDLLSTVAVDVGGRDCHHDPTGVSILGSSICRGGRRTEECW